MMLVALVGCAWGFVVAPTPQRRRTVERSAFFVPDHGIVLDAAHAAASQLPTLDLAAIQGVTCVNEGGPWCTAQNGVQGAIEGLHSFVAGPLGVKENAYGLSIILFTVACRSLTFPLNYISYESSARVKALKPYMDKIKERYDGDQQATNLATAKLYDMTSTNPLAGCLPSIAQIPVFIFLYRSVLNLAFDNKLDEPFLWLPSLEGPTYGAGRGIQWLSDNWVDGVPSLGWHDTLCFLALPIMLVITQSISMRVLTPPADPKDQGAVRAQRVLKYLPLLIGWFSANVPSGLGVYWMTSNVFSVVSSVTTKAYLNANPPNLDINLLELGIDDESAGVKLPNTIEEAIADAKINARPVRVPRRAGVPPLPRIHPPPNTLAAQQIDVVPESDQIDDRVAAR
ncbi:hypothetical protein CTAYLR_008237 [Chrysophaeum taylorii]|uniref:Membrane insertase YidC/Oxa/ALB C-terminal domain-containing protein n=1 Tax=Chrysophaeum taylorii TaxID=2483200 RepID=A0AAD7UID4_9STRA|nr:hypothetical protein CTAYLR_008237 [Chrysophaeum taylorii]